MKRLPGLVIALLTLPGIAVVLPAAEPPGPNAGLIERELTQARQTVERLSAKIAAAPQTEAAYSQRGDAYFFLGQFEAAISDYDKLVELDPTVDAGHWRRGIAYFYAGQYAEAAGQFERYHSFDNVDRENGIWRYFSQSRASGRDIARKGLLKYEKDDREPFPAVYRLFAGELDDAAVLKTIDTVKLSEDAREQRQFYAMLYIGLNAAVEERNDAARVALRKAVDNRWGPAAGYGPHYMWHVGRLHLQQLEDAAAKTKSP
jgi:lipoprotein NlpI